MANAKQMIFDDEARQKIRKGVKKLADAVRITMGPIGRNVILDKKFGKPLVTKDGVTVSKEIELEDPFENLGAKMVNEVASKTSDKAGDGTTTATVIAEAIYSEGLRRLLAGVNPMALRRGLQKGVATALTELEKLSKAVKTSEQIAHVGTISGNNDPEIGALFAEAMEKVKKNGVITVEEGKGTETEVVYTDGMQFDKGYISRYLMTNPENLQCELENPLILLHEKKVSSLQAFVPLLEKVAQTGQALVVIAEDVDGEALAALVVNKLRGVLSSVAVKAPGFGDRRKAVLEDIAILTGGRLISDDQGINLENLTLDDLGKADRVLVGKDDTTILAKGDKKKLADRVAQIRHLIETTTSDYDREKLEERLGRLAGGAAVIRVGVFTEASMKDRKARIEGALHATRAAVDEGIVPGGGVAFLRAIDAVKGLKLKGEERHGPEVLARALQAPIRQIAENAGLDGATVVEDVLARKGAQGLDAQTGDYTDLFRAGIVDPLKVTRTALVNAASLAGLMLTTNTMIADFKPSDEEKLSEDVVR